MDNIYSTAQAADYLGLAVRTVKHHIYKTGKLSYDGKLGREIYFRRSTLDAFKAAERKPGRPPKS